MQNSIFLPPPFDVGDYFTVEDLTSAVDKMEGELDKLIAKRDDLKRQENGLKLFKRMVSQGVIPDDISYFVGVDCTGKALVMSPDRAEFRSNWHEMHDKAKEVLEEVGLNPEEWFIPSKEILSFTYNQTDACAFMNSNWYWSADQVKSKVAYHFRCDTGIGRCDKERKGWVRHFRCISLCDGDPLHLP